MHIKLNIKSKKYELKERDEVQRKTAKDRRREAVAVPLHDLRLTNPFISQENRFLFSVKNVLLTGLWMK